MPWLTASRSALAPLTVVDARHRAANAPGTEADRADAIAGLAGGRCFIVASGLTAMRGAGNESFLPRSAYRPRVWPAHNDERLAVEQPHLFRLNDVWLMVTVGAHDRAPPLTRNRISGSAVGTRGLSIPDRDRHERDPPIRANAGGREQRERAGAPAVLTTALVVSSPAVRATARSVPGW
jgi:hypothetical protein